MVGTSNWGSWNDAIDVADVGAWPSGNSTVCELEYGPFMDDLLSEEFKMFNYQRVNILFCGSAVTYSITPNPLWWTWWTFSPMNPGLGYGMTPRRSAKLDACQACGGFTGEFHLKRPGRDADGLCLWVSWFPSRLKAGWKSSNTPSLWDELDNVIYPCVATKIERGLEDNFPVWHLSTSNHWGLHRKVIVIAIWLWLT